MLIIKVKLITPRILPQPEAVLVNNEAAAHLEGFGSIEGAGTCERGNLSWFNLNGVAIINSEHNNYIELWQKEIEFSCYSIF